MKTTGSKRPTVPVLLAGILFCWAGAGHAQSVTLDRIIAVVNDDVVLQSEFENRERLLQERLRKEGTYISNPLIIKKQVLDLLIMTKLQLQQATVSGVTVEEGVLDRMVGDIAARNGMSVDGFQRLLEEDGFSYEGFRQGMREELLVRRLRSQEIDTRVSISEEEIDYYLTTLESQGGMGREYRLQHILILEGGEPEEMRQRAEDLRKRLEGGEDFAALAEELSDAEDAAQGGDLGWRRLPEVPTVFLEHVPNLEVGGFTGPFEGGDGLHFVRLAEVRASDLFMEEQTRSRHILARVEEGNDGTEARELIAGLRERLDQGEDFAALAAEYSDDLGTSTEGGALGWVGRGALDPAFQQALDDLEPGELSEPFRSSFGWHVAQLLERRRQDRTEDARREQARETIRRRKSENAYKSWLHQLRDEAYVEYRLDWGEEL